MSRPSTARGLLALLAPAIGLGALGPAGAAAQVPTPTTPPQARPPAAALSSPAGWTLLLEARGDVGYDTNVFQADSATGAAYTRVGGLAYAARERGRTRLSARAEASRTFFPEFPRADELEGFLDLTARRGFGPLLGGIALRSAYLDMRLLDREGNLLPRTTFASFSNRLLAFLDLEVLEGLYLGAEAAYRLKDYEETSGLSSLDYREIAGELGLTRYFPGRLSARLRGSWEERAYRERRAADARGAPDAAHPELRLRRLEGEARLRKRWARTGMAEAVLGVRGSEDLFQDELSYTQRSAAVRLRQPLAGGWLAARAGVTDRRFELRRSGTGGPLEEEFLTLELEVERPLWPGTRARGGYALFGRSTNDVAGGYDVGTWRLGLVHVF